MGDPARHVVLVGLMGVGKSTVGRRLAKELQRPFADVDEHVELRAGRTIPNLFADEGEEAFRALETSVLEPVRAFLLETSVLGDLLASSAPLVLAAGGGVVTIGSNRAALVAAGAYVVWLRASPEFLAGRTDPTHRPLLAGDAAGTLARLAEERAPLYEAAADVSVDVEPFHIDVDKPKRALARHIADLLARTAATP